MRSTLSLTLLLVCLIPPNARAQTALSGRDLLVAAAKGDASAVKAFLAAGGKPDYRVFSLEGGRYGGVWTLVNAAVSSGSWDVVSLLVKDSAQRDEALMHALYAGNIQLSTRLKELSAHVPSNQARRTFLFVFQHEGRRLPLLKLLAETEFKFTADDLDTALGTILVDGLRKHTTKPDPEVLKAVAFLMRQPLIFEPSSRVLCTALHTEQFALIAPLIKLGAPVNPTRLPHEPSDSDTPLICALRVGKPEFVEAMLVAGASLQGRDGERAIRVAQDDAPSLLPLLRTAGKSR